MVDVVHGRLLAPLHALPARRLGHIHVIVACDEEAQNEVVTRQHASVHNVQVRHTLPQCVEGLRLLLVERPWA